MNEWFLGAETDKQILSSLKCFHTSLDLLSILKPFCLRYFFYCCRTVATKIDVNHKLTNLFSLLHTEELLYLNIKLVKYPNGSKVPPLQYTMSQAPTVLLILTQSMPSPLIVFVPQMDSDSCLSLSLPNIYMSTMHYIIAWKRNDVALLCSKHTVLNPYLYFYKFCL